MILNEPSRREEVADLGEQVDRISELLVSRAISSDVVMRLARSYEQIRVDMPSGDARTVAMTVLVAVLITEIEPWVDDE